MCNLEIEKKCGLLYRNTILKLQAMSYDPLITRREWSKLISLRSREKEACEDGEESKDGEESEDGEESDNGEVIECIHKVDTLYIQSFGTSSSLLADLTAFTNLFL